MDLSEQLKSLRKNYDLTQADLAAQSGVSYTFINRFENGHTAARLDVLNKVLDLLGCEVAIVDKKTKKVIEVTP